MNQTRMRFGLMGFGKIRDSVTAISATEATEFFILQRGGPIPRGWFVHYLGTEAEIHEREVRHFRAALLNIAAFRNDASTLRAMAKAALDPNNLP